MYDADHIRLKAIGYSSEIHPLFIYVLASCTSGWSSAKASWNAISMAGFEHWKFGTTGFMHFLMFWLDVNDINGVEQCNRNDVIRLVYLDYSAIASAAIHVLLSGNLVIGPKFFSRLCRSSFFKTCLGHHRWMPSMTKRRSVKSWFD